MFINASGSWNEYRYLLTYKHPAFEMASLHGPWEGGMQLPQRVGNNSIFLYVQRSLGLQVWELRRRAMRASDYTLTAVQQRISLSTNTVYRGFCTQMSSPDAMLLTPQLRSIMASVIGIIQWILNSFTHRDCPHACLGWSCFGVAPFLFVLSYLCWYFITFSSREVSRTEQPWSDLVT